MTEHTPGPWSVGCRYGYLQTEILGRGGSRVVAVVWTHDVDRDMDASYMATVPNLEGRANVCLIAAVPRLLAALEELVDLVQGTIDDGLSEFDSFTLQPARAAIAEAREL